MIFITDTPTPEAKKLLTSNKHHSLIIQTPSGQQFARYIAPKWGWTPWDLWQIRQRIPPQWLLYELNAYLGDVRVGDHTP